MPSRYRKKPLAVLEHGTRIYAPTPGEPRYRVVSVDGGTGERLFCKLPTEELARAKARELEQFRTEGVSMRGPVGEARRTVRRLADEYVRLYLADKSLRYQEKQECILRLWVLPAIADRLVTQWTSAESESILSAARCQGRSAATVQDIGAAMRALVTYARRLRWLTSQSADPMWLVSYSKKSVVQGQNAIHVPRTALPTDEQCEDLFVAMRELGEPRWALAMRVAHRSGLRWGELTALRAQDVEIEPVRVIHVRRAVQQPARGGPSIGVPKNGRTRTAIFPQSVADDLGRLVDEVGREYGGNGLLFPGRNGQFARRSSFQRVWIMAADRAGWPMAVPLHRSRGHGAKGEGWRWQGSARWTPHDLRHVAACWMLFDVGLDPAVVAEKLGHSDPSFTVKRYVGVRGDADLTAMALTDGW